MSESICEWAAVQQQRADCVLGLVLGHALDRYLAMAGLHSDACKAHRESSLQAPRQRKGLCGWVPAGAATLGLLHVVLDRQGSPASRV